MKIMGIESSCDETGVGIVELREDGHMDIIANAVASSMEQHARFGGVVPEIASRAHLEAMPQVMQAALKEAGITKPDAIAATVGPGLAGALLVEALKASAAVTPNLYVRERALHVAQRVREGASLRRAMTEADVFPRLLLAVVASGEQSGRLGPGLERAAADLEQELEGLVAAIVALVEPMVLLVMGGLVLLMVLSFVKISPLRYPESVTVVPFSTAKIFAV